MPGDYVAVSTSVVGRDPTFYSDPQEVRFDRKAPHMSLGSGIHKCLGMHLARLELQIAVEEFVTTLPEFRIKDGFKVRSEEHTSELQSLMRNSYDVFCLKKK